VLAWALESGHQVTALARNPQSLAAAAGLTVLTGDARVQVKPFADVREMEAAIRAARHLRTDRQFPLRAPALPGTVG
jgi:putative NADH-flavin reductase